MIVTEADAKTKWCFAARVPGHGGTTVNRHSVDTRDPPAMTRCFGAACMAWRWHGHVDAEGHIWEPLGEDSYKGVKERRGFCGLAGAP